MSLPRQINRFIGGQTGRNATCSSIFIFYRPDKSRTNILLIKRGLFIHFWLVSALIESSQQLSNTASILMNFLLKFSSQKTDYQGHHIHSGSLGLSNCYGQYLVICQQTGSSLEYNRWQTQYSLSVVSTSACNDCIPALRLPLIFTKLHRGEHQPLLQNMMKVHIFYFLQEL